MVVRLDGLVLQLHMGSTLYKIEVIFVLLIKEHGRGMLLMIVGWGKEGRFFQYLLGTTTNEETSEIEFEL